eukprot:CAMPEP_0170556640 /NCGR_PEP_ID=MMETSP0211-20121228/17881_1 /TAXON_ID=311385 /ORGANISM="Pseudokeronopsis sp., Strain OXSARD2" /LENGTH=161 /DNA_ID=CAMNT_0010867101 /DNA_START=549 /DNA_END=1033 /DNA_ORIENTATION=-
MRSPVIPIFESPKSVSLICPSTSSSTFSGFRSPIDNSVLVEVLQGKDNFCCVELSPLLIEALLLPQVIEQLASIEEVNHKVELLRGLEGIVQLHNEGVAQLLKNHPFSFGILLLVLSDDLVFLEGLHGKKLRGVSFLDEIDLAEGPPPNDLDNLEALHPYL